MLLLFLGIMESLINCSFLRGLHVISVSGDVFPTTSFVCAPAFRKSLLVHIQLHLKFWYSILWTCTRKSRNVSHLGSSFFSCSVVIFSCLHSSEFFLWAPWLLVIQLPSFSSVDVVFAMLFLCSVFTHRLNSYSHPSTPIHIHSVGLNEGSWFFYIVCLHMCSFKGLTSGFGTWTHSLLKWVSKLQHQKLSSCQAQISEPEDGA